MQRSRGYAVPSRNRVALRRTHYDGVDSRVLDYRMWKFKHDFRVSDAAVQRGSRVERISDRMGTHVEDFDTWRIPVLPNQWVRCHYENRHLFVGIARHRRRFCTSYLPNSHSWIAARE